MKKFVITLGLSLSCFVLSCYAQDLAMFKKDGKVGFINKSGEVVIDPVYSNGKSFSDGLAAVTYSGKMWGYIDSSGKFVIDPIFKRANDFVGGMAIVSMNGDNIYINKEGNEVNVKGADKLYEFAPEGVAIYKSNRRVGLIDQFGEVVLDPKYDVIRPFVNGYAKVALNNKWGIIDVKGNEVIPTKYEEIGHFIIDGYVWAKYNDSFGVIDNGEFKVIEGADKIQDIENSNQVIVRNGKTWGVVNDKQEWIIPSIYEDIRQGHGDLLAVRTGRKWGFINAKNERVISFKYDDAVAFSEDGLAAVKSHKWGFIDTKGTVVIPFEYDITAFNFSFTTQEKGFFEGVARVKKNKKWGFIDTKGNVLGNTWYDNLELFNKK
ncbi:WG repeat-containing protein [Myroides pelagicus]|uniref:WG repeat-containing protein n=1 Tax=Myroides pelagicus TaxID=270914 RepID=A0A7K1GKQ4_9FLAO|nr:WG repeat-containing protein [Myroides pelagicus]MEC4113298.1 WG repeat-containing protein [Myroides pelagicus]MTH29465.1 WG repeat-containing protein [Myroides pelagicus]